MSFKCPKLPLTGKTTYTNKISVLRSHWLNSELLSIAFKKISEFCLD